MKEKGSHIGDDWWDVVVEWSSRVKQKVVHIEERIIRLSGEVALAGSKFSREEQ